MRIKRIGHVGMTVPDVEATVDFYERILGLEVSQRNGNAVYLRCNQEHHCLSLFPGKTKALHHLGLVLSDEHSLDDVEKTIHDHGVDVGRSTTPEPGYGDYVYFRDPEENEIRLYAEMQSVTDTLSPREIRVRKFGHLTYMVKDFQRFMNFYIDILGFRLSDRIDNDIAWIRCDQDHHGVAFLASETSGVHHYAYELSDWNAMKRFCDNLWQNERVISWGLGRHGPGHNLFIYIGDNSDNIVELFAELDQIWDEETYEPLNWPNELTTMCVWGCAAPPADFMNGKP